VDSIWPAVEAGIRGEPEGPARRAAARFRLLRRATGVAAAAGVLFLLFLVISPPKPGMLRAPEVNIEDFRLDSLEIQGKPARAVFYQARDSQTLIIWAGESH